MSVTLLIVGITVIVSLMSFNNRSLFEGLKHHPYSEANNGEWYRFISSGFVHADYWHLGINMFVLYEFGRFVESIFTSQYGEAWGRIIFLLIYLLTIIIADIPSFLKHRTNPSYGAIGASGGVSGILFIFILYSPWSKLALYFLFPIPAIIFGVLYLAYSNWAEKKQFDNVGHDAHFWGAVAGMVLAIAAYPELAQIFMNRLMAG